MEKEIYKPKSSMKDLDRVYLEDNFKPEKITQPTIQGFDNFNFTENRPGPIYLGFG